MIPVYKPRISPSCIDYVKDTIESTWISSAGKYVDLATEKLKEVTGSKHVILTNNGTSAAHLVARSLKKFEPAVENVLVPSACYVAAYNSLIYDNYGWYIKCIDLDLKTWNMNIEKIEEGDAILAVHNLGNIINVPQLKERFGCPIIEDNCEGFFGTYNGISSGTHSLCSSLSFYGNKNITCGEGGAFLTNDKEIYDFALKIRGQGQSETRYIHDELGYNYRLTNVQAAILLSQLEDVDYIWANKKRVFERYKNNLKNIDGIKLQKEEENTSHSYWMFGVRFIGLKSYEVAEKYFNQASIDTRPMFYSYKKHKHLSFSGEDKNASKINQEVVIFPSYPDLSSEEIDYICDNILKLAKNIGS